jgi:hypothetical protein
MNGLPRTYVRGQILPSLGDWIGSGFTKLSRESSGSTESWMKDTASARACEGGAADWIPRTASRPHSIAKNAIEWGTRPSGCFSGIQKGMRAVKSHVSFAQDAKRTWGTCTCGGRRRSIGLRSFAPRDRRGHLHPSTRKPRALGTPASVPTWFVVTATRAV